jgi:hypothetical protein
MGQNFQRYQIVWFHPNFDPAYSIHDLIEGLPEELPYAFCVLLTENRMNGTISMDSTVGAIRRIR